MDFEEKLSVIYDEPTLPPDLSGKYHILSCLKYNDKKHIFLIAENSSENKFILKCAYGQFASLLKKEMSILQEAEKVTACPKLVDFAEKDDYSFLIREYVDGETIADIVGKKTLSTNEAFAIAEKVCHALQKLHSLEPPIIMRDIKPENIVIANGQCIFIDFDAAREWNEENSTDTVCIGTRTTAAPEQFGYKQTDIRTDIYAIGMLITYLLTGDYNSAEIKSKNARKVVQKCTQFSPEKRYRNAAEVCKAIKPGKLKYIAIPIAAVVAISIAANIIYLSTKDTHKISSANTYSFSRQASSSSDRMVSDALEHINGQAGETVLPGKTRAELVEYMLNDSEYAVFDGKEWPARATDNEDYFISSVVDNNLTELGEDPVVMLDSKSSASMSTGWFVSSVIYTYDVSINSFRVYVDGDAGHYDADVVADFFRRHLQAGEHIRIDETRSMSFISCDDNGFYFIEYGSDDNSDRHLRLRYYTFSDFVKYLNSLNKQMWYYEIEQSLNQ